VNNDQVCARELAGFGWDVALLLCVFAVVTIAVMRLVTGTAGADDVSMVSATGAASLLARLA